MAYSTDAKIRRGWNACSSTEVTDDLLSDVKIFVDGIIDSFIASRYDLPLSSTPGILEGISTDLAVIEVKKRKDPCLIGETDRIRESSCYAMLMELRDGKISLPDISQKQLVESDTEDYHTIFDVGPELEQVVDEDRLDDIEDARD